MASFAADVVNHLLLRPAAKLVILNFLNEGVLYVLKSEDVDGRLELEHQGGRFKCMTDGLLHGDVESYVLPRLLANEVG